MAEPTAAPPPALSTEEARRYARQLVLKGFGGAAQQRLKAARVLVVGAGALGSPVLAYLAAAGLGTIGIADPDSVALSNLQRQIVHGTGDLGGLKTASAARFAAALNPHVALVEHPVRLDAANGPSLAERYDLIVDGTDEYESRKFIAAAAEATAKPLVSGAVAMFDGQLTVLAPHLRLPDGRRAPRFSDLYPEDLAPDDVPSCEAVGVLGAVTGVVGALMAGEVIKLVTGVGSPLIGRLLLYDGKAARFTELVYGRGAEAAAEQGQPEPAGMKP